MNNDFKLIIFDLDGTLVDSSADVVDCFNYALMEEKLPPIPEKEIKRTIGYPLKEVFSRYGDAERLYSHFTRRAGEIMGDGTTLLPDVKETITELRNIGLKVAIATTKIRRDTERILRKIGISNLIDELSCADDVENVKPSPEPLLRLLKIFGFGKDETLMVGDTVNDIIAARNAGIKSAGLIGGFDDPTRIKDENPSWILNTLTEVVEIVRKSR